MLSLVFDSLPYLNVLRDFPINCVARCIVTIMMKPDDVFILSCPLGVGEKYAVSRPHTPAGHTNTNFKTAPRTWGGNYPAFTVLM
jgi:hypothetical protein